jgi:hypothetical protein
MIGTILDAVIKEHVNATLDKRDVSYTEPDDYAASDNLGEVLEKLAILHIRTWHLEDAMQEATADWELAALKRKVDICFKVKRPKLVAALNAIIDDAIIHNKSLREDSVKLYKGINE